MAFHKALLLLLSNYDFQVININKKFHKIATESLFFHGENIYESGNMNNINIILKKNYPSNKVGKILPLGNLQAKGIAKCGNIFYQLSGGYRRIFKYTFPNLDILTPLIGDSELGNGEGIGQLTEEILLATNGSNKIFILDCKNDLNVIKMIDIIDNEDQPINGLKDLVVVEEYIYAIKDSDMRILKIDAKTGKILKMYNMTNLIGFESASKNLNPNETSIRNNFLSGITHDYKRKIFIVTGKNWGNYYEVELK